MKLRIIELALDKRDIERNLQSKSPKIIEHLFYLMLDPKNQAANHWKQEIYSFLNDIDALKSSKKIPKTKFIYDNTYGYKRDRIQSRVYMKNFLKDVCQKENLSTALTLEEIMENLDYLCYNYFMWLSEMLHENEFVIREWVYDKIDELLNNLK